LRIFAETVANSSVAHVRAIVLLQTEFAKRMQALEELRASYNTPLPMLPFPGLLRMFGVVPLDRVRFRAGAITVTIIVLLAVFGLGALVAKL
jgi:hypothetical protein